MNLQEKRDTSMSFTKYTGNNFVGFLNATDLIIKIINNKIVYLS